MNTLPLDEAFRRAIGACLRHAGRVLLLPESMAAEIVPLLDSFEEAVHVPAETFFETPAGRLLRDESMSAAELQAWMDRSVEGFDVRPDETGWYPRLTRRLFTDTHAVRLLYLPDLEARPDAFFGLHLAQGDGRAERDPEVRARLVAGEINRIVRGAWRRTIFLLPGSETWNDRLYRALQAQYNELPIRVRASTSTPSPV